MILFWIIAIFSPPALEAGGFRFEDLCHRRASYAACVRFLIAKKCGAVFREWRAPPSNSVLAYPRGRCDELAEIAVRALDPTPVAGEAAMFSRNFLALLEDPRAFRFVRNLRESLAGTASSVELWDSAVHAAAGDRDLALEWLGVMFQDPTSENDSIRVFLNNPLASPKRFRELLLETLSFATPEVVQQERRIFPYPADIRLENPKYYHFYAIAWFAKRMRLGGASALEAARIGSMFNALYEFRQMRVKSWPWMDPSIKELLKAENDATLRDLHSGYLGAYWGAGWAASELPRYERWRSRFKWLWQALSPRNP